jgi:hypothetical protein
LGQLDSQPSFVRLGVAGEDIKDKNAKIHQKKLAPLEDICKNLPDDIVAYLVRKR